MLRKLSVSVNENSASYTPPNSSPTKLMPSKRKISTASSLSAPDFALSSLNEGRRSLDHKRSIPSGSSTALPDLRELNLIGEPRYRRVQSSSDLPDIGPFQLKAKLFKAIKDGEYSLVWALLSKGGDPSEPEDGGQLYSPLHIAAKEGNLPICQLLVSKGADVNAKDKGGQTPLHKAAYWGRYGVADFLVYVGANTKISDHINQTAHDVAMHRNNNEVAELLSPSRESKREKPWSVKKQFNQLLKDQAKEEKLLQKNRKHEEKLRQLLKEMNRLVMLHKEIEKRGKEVSKKDLERVELLEGKIAKVTEDLRKNTIEITITRSENFEKHAHENKATTWITFLEESI